MANTSLARCATSFERRRSSACTTTVSDRLRSADPRVVINCASVLRLEGRLYEAIDLLDGILVFAAVRQLWSVFEEVTWILNAHFRLELSEDACSFAKLFVPPSKEVRK